MMHLVLAGWRGCGRRSIRTVLPGYFPKDVLPILQKDCQSCHRPGQIAPMSLLTYQEARPWAKAIKTAVATRKCRLGSRTRVMAFHERSFAETE